MAEQASKISGIVQIDGTPVERTVRAFGYEAQTHAIDGNEVTLSRTLGHATSDPATGEYTIDLLAGYADPVFVVAFDDYGADFTSDMVLAVGDRIHPTTPNGHVWECTGAGTLPSEEPMWLVDTETAQLYGTASMIARPFYRPMVHGPVAPEVTEVVEPAPAYWRLYIYQGNDDQRIEFSELEFIEDQTAPATDSKPFTVTTNSNFVSGFGPDRLFDNDKSTQFITDYLEVSDIWIACEFTEAVNVTGVTIQLSAAEYRRPIDFALQKSADGISWQEVARWQYPTVIGDYQIEAFNV